MTREITTTCPSGMVARLRGLKGQEINLFANKTEAQARKIGYDLLRSLILDIEDYGPAYPGMGDQVDWRQVLHADRFWLYLQMRVATFGDDYVFRVQCQNRPCRKRFEWGLKMSSLGMKSLPQEAIATFVAGNVFGPIMIGDEEVKFQLITGEIEDKGAQMEGMKPDEAQTLAVANRIVSVGGREGRGKIHDWVKEADWLDVMDMIDALDEHDGGVETSIEVQCPRCSSIQEVELPLGQDFWTPSKELRLLARKEVVTSEPGGGPILRN